MSSRSSSFYADAELTASETMLAISNFSPKRGADEAIEAAGPDTMKTKAPDTSSQHDILPSKSSATASLRSLFSPPNKGAYASIVTPKSTIKIPRVTVESSATKKQEDLSETEDYDGDEEMALETPIFRRGTTADNIPGVKSSDAARKLRDLTSPSTVVLPLLTLRSAYNANAHEREQQSEVVAHVTSNMIANTTKNNNNGVASYVEQAAEEDIKTKLIMEINDLKQLLSGRKAQVDSLSTEKTNLEDKLQRLQASDRQRKKQRKWSISSTSPTPNRFAPTPARFAGEEYHQGIKILKEMQLEELKEEAVARGMDASNVTPMTNEALLDSLVIGTTCITKSSAWSDVLSLRGEIENEKVAIRLQEEDEKQRQLHMEKQREQKREKRLHKIKKEQDDQDSNLVPSSMIITDAGTAFTRDGMEALETATKAVCQSELQKDTTTPTTGKRSRGRPRKAAMKPSFGRQGSAFDGIVSIPSSASAVSYPSLAAVGDELNTHPSHAIIRRDILEAFVTVASKEDEEEVSGEGKKKLTRRRRYAGKVGFRCRYCKDKHVNEQAELSVIYPESIKGLYRANIRFQSKHIQTCQYIPQKLRDQLDFLKTCKEGMNRGNKNYWTESALRKGFRDWQSADGERKGIIYCPELNEELN